MSELRTGERDSVGQGPEVIIISDDEEPPVLTEDDKPICITLEEFRTLIQPVPKDKGETFNRAEYRVSPMLRQRTDESNRIVTEFLDVCIPHIRKKDLQLILERFKTLLCQVNLHYLASHEFQHIVIQMTRSIRDNLGTGTYMHLKELADVLRAHREKKPKQKAEKLHNSAPQSAERPEADSQASTSGVAGRSNQSSAAGSPLCHLHLSKTDTASKPSAVETSGPQRNPSGPQSPSAVSSTTVVQIPNSSTSCAPWISSGEQPGTSGAAGRVGNHGHDSTQVKREFTEQQQMKCVGRVQEGKGLSHKDAQNIKKLLQYLLELCGSISKLREEEVDFNEDDEASAYIQEDRLIKRAWKIWHKICRLEGRRPRTGTQREKRFQFTGTPYCAINAAVEKLVNKKIFPDFTDICNLVKQVNEQEGLGLGAKETQTIAEEVFTSVGQELQRRRQADELSNVMAYLGEHSDYYRHDPAESDPGLMAKLEENAKVYKKRMNDVIQTYVNREQELKLQPQEVKEEDCNLSPESDGNNSSEDEEDDDNIDDDMNLEKDPLLNSSLIAGEQGTKVNPEVLKPLCAAGSSVALASKESSKSPVAGDGIGRASTGNPNSAALRSIKCVPGGPSSSGPSRDSSGIAQLNSSICGSSAAPDLTITRVPGTAVAGDGLGRAPRGDPNPEAQRSIKAVPGGPSSSGLFRDSSGIAQLNCSIYGSSAAPGPTITRVPASRGAAQFTIIASPVTSRSTQLNISPVPVASSEAGLSICLATGCEHGKPLTKNRTIFLPDVSIFPVQDDKFTSVPKANANGRELLGKKRRCSHEKEHEADVITIPSDDDEISLSPAKALKTLTALRFLRD